MDMDVLKEVVAPVVADFVKEMRTENEKLRARVETLEREVKALRWNESNRTVRERVGAAACDDDD